jgi:hypothetical protein
MKLLFLLLMIAVGPASAEPLEPANVTAAREQFLRDMAALGTDPQSCRMDYLETEPEGHYTQVQCTSLQYTCIVLVHPTEVLVKPMACEENPNYQPESDKQRL